MFISKRKLNEYIREIKDQNRKEKLYAKYPADTKEQEIKKAYSVGYEDGTDNMYNALVHHFKLKR